MKMYFLRSVSTQTLNTTEWKTQVWPGNHYGRMDNTRILYWLVKEILSVGFLYILMEIFQPRSRALLLISLTASHTQPSVCKCSSHDITWPWISVILGNWDCDFFGFAKMWSCNSYQLLTDADAPSSR
jgi:hypothetical protein